MSPALNIEVEQNGKPSLVDLNEEMQHMDVEESQCELNYRAVVHDSKRSSDPNASCWAEISYGLQKLGFKNTIKK